MSAMGALKGAAPGVGIGVLVVFAWNIHAEREGLPPMPGEVGAAVGAVIGPIYSGGLEVLGAIKDRLVGLIGTSKDHPSQEAQAPKP